MNNVEVPRPDSVSFESAIFYIFLYVNLAHNQNEFYLWTFLLKIKGNLSSQHVTKNHTELLSLLVT